MKKKIASSILALSLAFNMAFVNVYAENGENTEDIVVVETTDGTGSGANLGDATDVVVTLGDDEVSTIGSSVKISGGTINFGSDIFDTTTSDKKVGQIKIVGDKVTKEGIVEFESTSIAKFYFENNGELTLDDDTTYTITLLDYGNYQLSDYKIADYKPKKSDEASVTFTATKDSDNSTEKATVSGTLTFVDASDEDLENANIQLQFSAEGKDSVVADLIIKETRVGYFDVELEKGVIYTLTLLGIDSYTMASYSLPYAVTGDSSSLERFATKVDGYSNSVIELFGILTFEGAEFDQETFTEDAKITFTPTKGGKARTSKLEYKGSTTLTYYFNDILESKEYTVTISGVDGYTLSETFTTPAKADNLTKDFTATAKVGTDDNYDDDDNQFVTDAEGGLTVTTPKPGENETFGNNVTSLKGKIESLLDDVIATLKPIATSGGTNTFTKINDTITTAGSKFTSDNGDEITTTTVEYDAPLVMFDLSLAGYVNGGDNVEITIEFEPIILKSKGSANSTYLNLFHFDENGTSDIIKNAKFTGNAIDGYTAVTFTTNNFSPFAIAQGYSTVKITQSGGGSSGSDSSSGSGSSSNSSSGTVSAVGSDGTTYYITGNIPTVGFISQLRGVTVGELINLDKITVTGKTIIGWFYDRDFTKQVEDTSNFVITQDVMDNGIYPQFEIVVETLGASVSTSTSDYSSNAPIYTNVPSTSVALGASLF